jgi:hypothetical protein
VGSRTGVSGTHQPRGGVLGLQLHCNGHRPLAISHRPDGACDVRTDEPLLGASWVQRSVIEILKLVCASASADGVGPDPDSDSHELAVHVARQLAELQASLEVAWEISLPRWMLCLTTVNDAKPSYLVFSADLMVPAMLCIASGERSRPEAETVYFAHLAGKIPRQGQV